MLAIDSIAVSLCSEKEGRLTVSLEDYVQYNMIHLCDCHQTYIHCLHYGSPVRSGH